MFSQFLVVLALVALVAVQGAIENMTFSEVRQPAARVEVMGGDVGVLVGLCVTYLLTFSLPHSSCCDLFICITPCSWNLILL